MAQRVILVTISMLAISPYIFQLTASEQLCFEKDKLILELQLENSRLKLEKLDLSAQNEKFRSETINCTALADEAAYLAENLKRIQNDVEPFTSLLQKKFGAQANASNVARGDEWLQKVSAILEIVKKSDAVNKNPSSASDENSMGIKTILEKIVALETHLKESERLKQKLNMPSNCAEADDGKVGVFKFQAPNSVLGPFEAACDADNWMIVLRRMDGSVDFYRDWNTYRAGFGAASGEYFIGLENLHKLTTSGCYKLKIELEDFENKSAFAQYKRFEIGSEQEQYKLKVLGEYTGSAGDALSASKSMKFSTHDRDNDQAPWNCARKYGGAWWHDACSSSQLTGFHDRHGASTEGNGIEWYTWRFPYSFKSAKMLIRPC